MVRETGIWRRAPGDDSTDRRPPVRNCAAGWRGAIFLTSWKKPVGSQPSMQQIAYKKGRVQTFSEEGKQDWPAAHLPYENLENGLSAGSRGSSNNVGVRTLGPRTAAPSFLRE